MTPGTGLVLLYHEVEARRAAAMPEYSVTPTAFRRQLEELLERGRRLVTVTDLVQRSRRGEDMADFAAVTFDDGFRSFLTHALDVIDDLDVAATMYVPTRWVGGAPGWIPGADRPTIMSADEIAWLAGGRVEIGGHTHSHLHLDLLRSDQARSEVVQNKEELETLLGRKVRSFAYPHGSHDRRVREIVRGCGYDHACAVNGPTLPTGDEFRIGRVVATEDADVDAMTSELRRLGQRYSNGRASLRTAAERGAYRAARRLRLHRHHRALMRASP